MIYLVEVTATIDAVGTTEVLRFSSQNFTTEPSDTPPNAYYDARVVNPASISRNMFSNGTTSGASRVGYGTVELSNIDGALDYLLPYSFDGRSLVIKIGVEGAAFSTFTTVLNGTMEQIEFTFAKATILVRDKLAILDKPLQTTLYSGNNSLPAGVEGVADIAKKPKPLLFGQVFNIQPIMVNSSKLIYQINDGAIASIDAVYDRGVPLIFHADEPTIADMELHDPPAGKYTTCLASGYIRIKTVPSGLLTCDATQGAAAGNRTVAQILKAIALKGGVSAGDIVAGDVTALDTLNSSVVGVWLEGLESSINIMDMIATSIGAYYGFDATGFFRMGRFDAPSGAANIEISFSNIISIEHNRTSDTDKGIPAYRVNVSYQKNYTVQDFDLAAATLDARRNVLAQSSLTVSSENLAIKTQYSLAATLVRDSLLVTQANAQTEADRVLALYKVNRSLFTVRIALDLTETLPDLVNVANLTLNRFGLNSGKLFKIIGIEADYSTNRATLTLWG